MKPTLAVVVVICVCGCGGSVLVEHDVRVDVAMRDEAGRPLPAGGVTTVARPRGISIAFDWARYQDADIDWTFGGLGGGILNRAADEQCLRYDQARVASSMHEESAPLAVYYWSVFRDGQWSRIGTTAPGDQRPFKPPALCLKPAEEVILMLKADIHELFPNGRMFNTSPPEGDALAIREKGSGNWIRMQLPVDIGKRRRTMDVRITAVDAKARVSYY